MSKKLIFCIIGIVLVVCLSCYIGFNNKINSINDINNNNTNIDFTVEKNNEEEIIEQKLYGLESVTDYYTVRSCIIKYFLYYDSLSSGSSELSKEELLNQLYSLLDKSYIAKYNITLENIEDKYSIPINETEVFIDKVLYEKTNNIYTYFINGTSRDRKTNVINDIRFIVCLDTKSETFSLFLEDYIRDNKLDNIKEGDVIDFKTNEIIQDNNLNRYKPYKYSYDEYIEDMYEKIRKYMLYSPEKAYEFLNKKDSKINSYSKFESFINDNYKEIYTMTMDSYLFEYNYKEECMSYNCKDKYDNLEVLIYADNPCDMKFTILKK